MRIIPIVASHVSTNDDYSVGVILETTRPDNFLFEKAVREAAAGVISVEEASKFREVGSTPSVE